MPTKGAPWEVMLTSIIPSMLCLGEALQPCHES